MRVPLPLTFLVAIALAACGGGTAPTATSAPTTAPAGATATAASTPAATATGGGGGGTAEDISCNDGVVGSEVSIVEFAFQPQSQVADGDNTVNWRNNGERAHTVTFDNGKDCGTLGPTETLTVLFLAPGTYAYHCDIHKSMKGSITVNG